MTIMCVYKCVCGIKKTVATQGQNVGQTQAPTKKPGLITCFASMFSQTFAFLLTHCGCSHTNLMFELLLLAMYIEHICDDYSSNS